MIRNLVLCAAVVSAWFSPASARPSNDELKVMSFNIRIDTKADGPNQWSNRRDSAANMIRFYDIDIFGAQEVFANQMTDLQERLPEYGSIGIGLEDGKSKGQHDPIFWKKERFELLDHGFFWFAEDINAIGQRAWDAASPRMGSWAILKDKISKRKLFFMNVHIDHIGQVARRESAKLILDRLGALAGDLPVIVTGDFNAEPDSEPIRILLDPANPEHLTHTRSVAPVRYGPEWSYHNYGRLAKNMWLDYIFVRGGLETLRHGCLAEKLDDLYISDHCPVMAGLRFTK